MNEFTPLQILDFIINELHTPLTYEALASTVTSKHKSIDNSLVEQGIEKLREDGYVYVVNDRKYVTDLEIENGWMIRRTYNGEIIVLNGGIELNEINNLSQRRAERHRQRWLIFGTAVAGVGALLLVAWEMYKTLCLHKD